MTRYTSSWMPVKIVLIAFILSFIGSVYADPLFITGENKATERKTNGDALGGIGRIIIGSSATASIPLLPAKHFYSGPPEFKNESTLPYDNYPIAVSGIEIESFIKMLEADRLLLVEIRKKVPTVRKEAGAYFARLKELSGRSDSIRLVPLANRILQRVNIFYTWMENEYRSEEERVAEYYIGGASGFHFALEEFKSAVLFTAINRLDMAARVIREFIPETHNQEL